MKKINLIWIVGILAVLLMPSSFAALNLSANNLLFWWKPAGNVITDSSSYARILSNNGDVNIVTTNLNIGNSTGYFNDTSIDDPLIFTTGAEFLNVHNFT